METTYSELLKNPKWAKIKNEIIERDSLECQNCKNEKIKIKSASGEIICIKRIRTAEELCNKSDPRFKKLYKVKFLDAFKEVQEFEIKAFNEYNKEELEKFKGHKLFYNRANNLSFLNTDAEYRYITCIPDPTLKYKFFHAEQLHVHHTYYRTNRKPWEYPLESLKTLCWICHKKEHSN